MARHHDRTSAVLADASAAPADAPVFDALSDVLRAVRLTGACFFRVEASSPWWAEVPDAEAVRPTVLPRAHHLVSYHVITEGRCWAGLRDGTGLWVEKGDTVLVPHGDCYALSTAPRAVGDQPIEVSRTFFRQMVAHELPLTLCAGGGGPGGVGIICGFLGCDAAPFNPVLAMLPRLVRVPPPPSGATDRLAQLVDFALAESRDSAAGSECVLARVGELLFVEVLRRHARSLPPGGQGWLSGLRDPLVCRALGLLHQHPARPWTLEALAHESSVSRTTLAERFTHFVGQPPMRYLARWRMQLAARRLADGEAKVAAVAFEVGYDSEAAFSRAFKKLVGVAPAAWRRRHA